MIFFFYCLWQWTSWKLYTGNHKYFFRLSDVQSNVLLASQCARAWTLTWLKLIVILAQVKIKWRLHGREPRGPSSCAYLQILLYESTRSISTPPWMGCYSIERWLSPAFNSPIPIYTPGWREALVGVKCLAQGSKPDRLIRRGATNRVASQLLQALYFIGRDRVAALLFKG